MLVEFSVENFRSFKEQKTLSMLASADKSLDFNLIEVPELGKDRLLKCAVIYGGNASGKTNVINSLHYLRYIITSSHRFQKGDRLPYQPFLFDRMTPKEPSRFGIAFFKNGVKYRYGLSLNSERILDEYLYYFPKGRKSIVFERKDGVFRFTKDIGEQKAIEKTTLDNVSYLSHSTRMKYRLTTPAFEWFNEDLVPILSFDHPVFEERAAESFHEDPSLKSRYLKALSRADLSIDDLKVRIDEVEWSDFEKQLPPELIRMFDMTKTRLETDKVKRREMATIHRIRDADGTESEYKLDFDNESEGTKRMFNIIGLWLHALDNGRVIAMDELDVKLHYFLILFLIRLFQDPEQNKTNAQLIFTTHNTKLLDLDIFRRDQIWFTEKNQYGEYTDLFSLSDFKPRKDKDIEKGYLAGRYGALPMVRGGDSL